MRYRLFAGLFGAALLLTPALAKAGGAPNGAAENATPEARLHRDEQALAHTARDLADLARQRFEAGERHFSASARRSLAQAESATNRALEHVRRSLDALLPSEKRAPAGSGK